MIILEDVAQKVGKHVEKNNWFSDNDIKVLRFPLPVGDYIIANDKVLDVIRRKNKRENDIKKMDFVGTYDTVVDTKKDIQELYSDLIQDHLRFNDELILAQNNGIKLYILVENKDGIKSLDDFIWWKNPRLFMWIKKGKKGKPPVDAERLQKTMLTMQEKYGCKFLFCQPSESAYTITKLLKGEI